MISLKTCIFPGCDNKFPAHYHRDVCGNGGRHVFFDGSDEYCQEFVTAELRRRGFQAVRFFAPILMVRDSDPEYSVNGEHVARLAADLIVFCPQSASDVSLATEALGENSDRPVIIFGVGGLKKEAIKDKDLELLDLRERFPNAKIYASLDEALVAAPTFLRMH